MRAYCHTCDTTFRVERGGLIRCPNCAQVINLGGFDHFIDGPHESAYFGWGADSRRRLAVLEDSLVVQAVATVGNAAARLLRSVVQRVVRTPGAAPVGAADAAPVHDHHTDELRLR